MMFDRLSLQSFLWPHVPGRRQRASQVFQNYKRLLAPRLRPDPQTSLGVPTPAFRRSMLPVVSVHHIAVIFERGVQMHTLQMARPWCSALNKLRVTDGAPNECPGAAGQSDGYQHSTNHTEADRETPIQQEPSLHHPRKLFQRR